MTCHDKHFALARHKESDAEKIRRHCSITCMTYCCTDTTLSSASVMLWEQLWPWIVQKVSLWACSAERSHSWCWKLVTQSLECVKIMSSTFKRIPADLSTVQKENSALSHVLCALRSYMQASCRGDRANVKANAVWFTPATLCKGTRQNKVNKRNLYCVQISHCACDGGFQRGKLSETPA